MYRDFGVLQNYNVRMTSRCHLKKQDSNWKHHLECSDVHRVPIRLRSQSRAESYPLKVVIIKLSSWTRTNGRSGFMWST